MIAYAELVDIIMQNVSWVDSHDLAKTDGVLDCFRHVISDSVCSRTGKPRTFENQLHAITLL